MGKLITSVSRVDVPRLWDVWTYLLREGGGGGVVVLGFWMAWCCAPSIYAVTLRSV